jgi:lipopolysaccharide/colanic/teichoic acid biosynthesis glycosyltransferase
VETTDRLYLGCKRIIDVIGASIALVLLLPLLIVVALAIFLDDPGPILFPQMRVGRDNQLFRFYKFRSMVKNAAQLQATLTDSNEATGPIFKMRSDPRVTRVGRILRKYSIDELPQLFNVIRGDMSLVGPRPHLPSEVALYTPEQYVRLSVQPGLVCMREVTGRSELTFDRWIETDLQYIACRSLRTDLSILLRLVPAVIGARGAY